MSAPEKLSAKAMADAASDLFHLAEEALNGIEALAKLALHECERPPGEITGELIVSALEGVARLANECRDAIWWEAESAGVSRDIARMYLERRHALARALRDAPPPACTAGAEG